MQALVAALVWDATTGRLGSVTDVAWLTYCLQGVGCNQGQLEVLRDGKQMKVTAAIKEQPVDLQTTRVIPRQDQPQPQTPPDTDEQDQGNGGLRSIQVGELTPELAHRLDLPNGVRGVIVNNVDPDSGIAELQKGDVIEEVNQQPVGSVADYNKLVGSLDPGQTQVL